MGNGLAHGKGELVEVEFAGEQDRKNLCAGLGRLAGLQGVVLDSNPFSR